MLKFKKKWSGIQYELRVFTKEWGHINVTALCEIFCRQFPINVPPSEKAHLEFKHKRCKFIKSLVPTCRCIRKQKENIQFLVYALQYLGLRIQLRITALNIRYRIE